MSKGRARALAALVCVAVATACGGDSNGEQPPSGGGNPGPSPAPGISRLSWTQLGPTLALVQGYQYVLFTDGARTTLTGVACAAGTESSSSFECSAPLPSMSPGRHVLELSAVNPATGGESMRSDPLAVGGASVAATIDVSAPRAADDGSSAALPSSTCAAGDASLCYTVALEATSRIPIRRIITLTDGRTLLLHEEGYVTFLPAGRSERLELGRQEISVRTEVTDVAMDAAFAQNRLLYFATVTTTRTGERRVDVVRTRELADSIGEAATIVTLPAAAAGAPAVSAGVDERVYLAMPSATPAVGSQPHDGRLLRFTRDGAAAGSGRSGSPLLAPGSARPVSLAWEPAAGLLIASADPREPPLAFVSVDSYSDARVWPASAIAVAGFDDPALKTGLRALAVAPARPSQSEGSRVAFIGNDPATLYVGTLAAGARLEVTALQPLALGAFSPAAVAFASTGDLLVAGRAGPDDAGHAVLRLRTR